MPTISFIPESVNDVSRITSPENAVPYFLHHLLYGRYHLRAYINSRSNQFQPIGSYRRYKVDQALEKPQKSSRPRGGSLSCTHCTCERMTAMAAKSPSCGCSSSILLSRPNNFFHQNGRTYSHRRRGVGGVGVDVGVNWGMRAWKIGGSSPWRRWGLVHSNNIMGLSWTRNISHEWRKLAGHVWIRVCDGCRVRGFSIEKRMIASHYMLSAMRLNFSFRMWRLLVMHPLESSSTLGRRKG